MPGENEFSGAFPEVSLKDRLLAALVRRLPRGRYPVAAWLARGRKDVFLASIGATKDRVKFLCPLGNWIAQEVFYQGFYSPQETLLLGHLLPQGGVLVDVGANWGYFSLLGADLVGPSGRVLSFEPHPRLFALLEANLRQNGFRAVKAVRLAIGDADGVLHLADFAPDSINWGTAHLASADGERAFEVPAAPLASALDREGVGAVDLLKIDIEGAEAMVLPAAEPLFASHRIKRLLVEVHPQEALGMGRTVDPIPGLLARHGYQAWVLDESTETSRQLSYSFKGSPSSYLSVFDVGTPIRERIHLLFLAPNVSPTW